MLFPCQNFHPLSGKFFSVIPLCVPDLRRVVRNLNFDYKLRAWPHPLGVRHGPGHGHPGKQLFGQLDKVNAICCTQKSFKIRRPMWVSSRMPGWINYHKWFCKQFSLAQWPAGLVAIWINIISQPGMLAALCASFGPPALTVFCILCIHF